MERKKYCKILASLLFLLGMFIEIKGEIMYSDEIYQAYISGDMDKWKEVMDKMADDSPSTTEEKLQLINYYYGYVAYLIENKSTKEAGNYIKKAEIILNNILKENSENPSANAYKGSFLSFKMTLSKFRSPTLGPQSMKYINRAYKYDPQDIQAILDKANLLYYAPSIFGGDKKEALIYYKEGIRKMEDKGLDEKNWYYLNVLTSLALHYEKISRYEDAYNLYEKILLKEPEFVWVKQELMPALKEKITIR